MRATIHVVTAKDFLALRPAIQPVLESAMQAILKERLDGIDLTALTKQVRKMLESEPLTFAAIREEFLRADPKADERAMGYAVRMLLPLVQVPVDGQAWAFPSQACFAPAEQWLDKAIASKAVQPDALLLRYLEGYGPASADDMRAWSGLARTEVKEAIERLRPKLVVFRDVGGKRELFDLPDAPRPDADAPAPVRLIPEYDNVITTRADERFVAKADRPRVFLSALRIAATVLVDGFAAGTWKLEATKKAATLTIEPFKPLAAKVKKEVEAEAESLLKFAEPEARTPRSALREGLSATMRVRFASEQSRLGHDAGAMRLKSASPGAPLYDAAQICDSTASRVSMNSRLDLIARLSPASRARENAVGTSATKRPGRGDITSVRVPR